MSKLSPALKALVNAQFAKADMLPAPAHIRSVYETIKDEAKSKDVGTNAWVVLSVRNLEDCLRAAGGLIGG